MKDVILYRFDQSLTVVEDGLCSLDRAMQEIDHCSASSATHFESGEESMRATSFGLSRSEEDFIEVSFTSPDIAAIHCDRLHFPSWMTKVFSSKGQFWIKETREGAKKIVESYFNLPRREFEVRYERFLHR